MSFSLSGSVITQSGTDTSLAGLSGIAGVTTRTLSNGIVLYNTSNLQLVINGSLSWNQEVDILETGASVAFPNITISSGGSMTVGATEASGDFTRRTVGTALICATASPNTFDPAAGSIQINSGGAITLNGAIVYHYGMIYALAGSTFTSNNGTLITPNGRHRWFYSGISGTGLSLIYGVFNTISNLEIANLSPQLLQTVYTTGASPIYRNYLSGQSTSLDFRAQTGGVFICRNLVKGSSFVYSPNAVTTDNNATNYGGVVSIKELRFNLNANISNCSVLIPYSNSGNRRDGLGYTFTTLNYENARTNSSGIVDIDLYTAAVIRTTAGVAGSPLVGENRIDYRGKTGVAGEDFFDAYFCHYNYLLQSISNFAAKGADRLELKTQLFADPSIVETSKSVAAAYTGYAINTGTNTITFTDSALNGARAYDYWKSWKDNNHYLQYPTISSLICVKNGTTLDFGSINLVINGVTWASHATVTKVKTTGTITVSGGGDYAVVLEDSTGTRYRPLITVSNFPNSSKVTIIYGGTPIDVATTNAPYSFRFPNATPATVTVQVEKTGYKAFSQDVPLALADVTVFAVLIALTDADAINSPDVNFRRSFVNDSAVLAIMKAANGDASLQDYLGRAAVFDFDVLAWKNDWNAIAGAISGTTPTLTDVNRWRAYATDSGYAIVFLDNGEVV